MSIYISLDIEADGPCPGENSMLQLGAAMFDDNGVLLESWQRNLETLPDAIEDTATMKWWHSTPELRRAYEKTRICLTRPFDAIADFNKWAVSRGKPTAVCYPSGFDFTWVYWYCHRFAHRFPFGFQAIDIKSFAAAVLKLPYRDATKRNMPKEWFVGLPPHTHDGCDDAIEQGYLFFKVREASK